MDERAQDTEQRPTHATHRDERSSSHLPGPSVLPRAAGGGAGGIAVEVVLGVEPTRAEPAGEETASRASPAPVVVEPETKPSPAEYVEATRAPAPVTQLPSAVSAEPWPRPEPSAAPWEEPQIEPDRAAGEEAGAQLSAVVPPTEDESVIRPREAALAPADVDPPAPPDHQPEDLLEPPSAMPPPPEQQVEPALLTRIPTVALIRPLDVPVPSQIAPELTPTEPEGHQDREPAQQALPEEMAAPTWHGSERPPAAPVLQRMEPHDVREHGLLTPVPEVVPPVAPGASRPAGWPTAIPFPAPESQAGRRLRLALTLVLAVAGGLAVLVLTLAILYRWVDPPMSTLMLGQRLAGMPVAQRWVPLERISPNLSSAVITSEDAHFCHHHGVDWGELKEAIDNAGDGLARGGSTITMQVVKNLFLWPSRSYVRKAMEIPLAFVIEALWPKRRILEIYLNIAEWGPGVFGAEAAARYHFRKPALVLSPREAALLAVSLPNPIDRQAGRPGPGTQRLADRLMLRMRPASATTACLRGAAGRR